MTTSHTTPNDDHVHVQRIGRQSVRVSDRPGSDPQAPPLLLLMGLGGNLEMWEPLRTALATHGGMRTLAFDVPGAGGSPAPWFPRPLQLFGELTRRLLRRLEVPRVDVLGLSWGGLLAQQLAVTSPRRVRRVVLASTNYGLGSVPGSLRSLRALASRERYRSIGAFSHAMDAFGGADPVAAPIAAEHLAARVARPPTARGYYQQLLAPACWSSLGALPLMRQPTLVLAGDADHATPVVNARILARLIPDARLHVREGAGHLMLFQWPDEFAGVITAFLREERDA